MSHSTYRFSIHCNEFSEVRVDFLYDVDLIVYSDSVANIVRVQKTDKNDRLNETGVEET